MKRSSIAFVAALSLAANAGHAAPIDISWVTVGDAGNAPDKETMRTDGTSGYGAVDHAYRIGQYEVTNEQYCAFLNAVAANDAHNLYYRQMGASIYGGITRSGSPGDYSYATKPGCEKKPVNYVNFYSSLRFANWLHNGQPTGGQNAATTENGAYDLSQGAGVTRKPGARVFLPSEDEWYKAAYYKGGGTDAGYWNYATQSDKLPVHEPPPGGANSANYYHSVHGLAVPDGNHISKAGAYVNSQSAYGTHDQTGNMWEWTEGRMTGSQRVTRGGPFNSYDETHLPASCRFHSDPLSSIGGANGFRVASTPGEACPEVIPNPPRLPSAPSR